MGHAYQSCVSVAGSSETILVKPSIHLATEETKAKVLEATLIANVFGTDGNALIINCSPVKDEVKGKFARLIKPALTEVAAGGNVTIKSEQKEGDPITGTCLEETADCEGLAKEPLLASLGSGFEDAAEQFTVTDSFNKMAFIDD